MAYLITQILFFMLVAAALGLGVGWLVRDLVADRQRRLREQYWRRQLRQSESQAGTYKNQLTEARQTGEQLREELRQARDIAIMSGPKAVPRGDSKKVAELREQIEKRDKKIEILQLQVSQSSTTVNSEWQSLKALKSDLAERQRRLEARGKQLEARWSGKLKESEEARRRLEQHVVALKRARDRLEEELAAERRMSPTWAAGLEMEIEDSHREGEEPPAQDAEPAPTVTEPSSNEGEEHEGAASEDEDYEDGEYDGDEPDDLEQIRGVGPVLHRKLNELGIHSFRQIAAWTDDDIDWFTAELGSFAGRVRRDKWVERAAELMRAKS